MGSSRRLWPDCAFLTMFFVVAAASNISHSQIAFIISALLNVVARPSQVKDIIAKINPEFVYTYKDTSDHPWPARTPRVRWLAGDRAHHRLQRALDPR